MKLIGNLDIWHQILLAKLAASHENRPLPHTLFSGAAGCGKTSTAKQIANKSNTQFIKVAPENIKSPNDVVEIIDMLDTGGYDKYGNIKENTKLNPPIVFIDEIHRLSEIGQEHLGIAMEEWCVPISPKKVLANPYDKFGAGTAGRVRWCPMFTLIGATTNDGLLTKPFLDRFKMKLLFTTYSDEESASIAKVHAEKIGIGLDDGGAKEISKRGRGVPRIIVGLLERCRDFALSVNKNIIDTDIAKSTFIVVKVDNTGLTNSDVKILVTLYNSTEPIGLDNLSIITNESKKAISETIEPYLVQRGFILRGSRGRILTEQGKNYLIKQGHIKIDKDDNARIDIPSTYKRSLQCHLEK